MTSFVLCNPFQESDRRNQWRSTLPQLTLTATSQPITSRQLPHVRQFIVQPIKASPCLKLSSRINLFTWLGGILSGVMAGTVRPSAGTSEPGKISPYDLRCEYQRKPLGLDARKPRFSWKLASIDRGQVQTACQILVADSKAGLAGDSGNLWDSGNLVGADSVHVEYAGAPLQSGQEVFWKVRCWDRLGKVSSWSETASFELGLLGRNDWRGEWIGGGSLLRHEFHLEHPIARARVYIAALGYYELYINGERIGDAELAPAQTEYHKRALYNTHDVTDYLNQGQNAIGVMVGPGWLYPTSSNKGSEKYPDHPAVLLQANVDLTDGSRVQIQSGGTWNAMSGPVLKSEQVRGGEVYDARLERPGWNLPGYTAKEISSASVFNHSQIALSTQYCEPDRVVNVLEPRQITEPEKDVFVFDFGQNMAGRVRLHVKGPSGAEIVFRYAELLAENGGLDEYTTYKQTDRYILKGEGIEEWNPRFTYHGFRFVEIEGFSLQKQSILMSPPPVVSSAPIHC